MLTRLAARVLGSNLGSIGRTLPASLKPCIPEEDHAMVFPCASVMVTMVLLKVAATCATPEMIFLRSLRRGARVVAGFAIGQFLTVRRRDYLVTFFLPAIATALPFRVRAFVCVR